jgi:DNA-binding NtrC family response regulator
VGHTISLDGSLDEPTSRPKSRPLLFLVGPAVPLRLDLSLIDEINVGRGDEARVALDGRRLALDIDDRYMSRPHARVGKGQGGFELEDLGSKNGCRLNGVACRASHLAENDLLELGATFFRFRTAPVPDGDAVTRPRGSLATIVPELEATFARLELVAPSDLNVLLQGETGTGKEVVARAVHALSRRRGELVAVNCGAIPAELVEAELFGARRGAFTGAEERPGHVRAAAAGTLFLDEIGDLPLPAQAALLRVLQEREVVPVGGGKPIRVDFRLVAATHRDLGQLVAEGKFREDLLMRLGGLRVELPPLRERREDLGLLGAALLGERSPGMTAAAFRAIFAHEWPGNVRELATVLRTAVVLAGDGPIDARHLPEEIRRPAPRPARETDEEKQKAELVALLSRHEGNIAAVARELGKARVQIQRLMKKWSLDPSTFRP